MINKIYQEEENLNANHIPTTFLYLFNQGPVLDGSEEERGVIIVWDRDIIVMNSPILVPPRHTALNSTALWEVHSVQC